MVGLGVLLARGLVVSLGPLVLKGLARLVAAVLVRRTCLVKLRRHLSLENLVHLYDHRLFAELILCKVYRKRGSVLVLVAQISVSILEPLLLLIFLTITLAFFDAHIGGPLRLQLLFFNLI